MDKSGYIYIVEIFPGKIKVGMSINPSRRLRQLSLAAGVKFSRVWVSQPMENYRWVEKRLHCCLSHARRIGEYFNFSFDKAVELALGHN